MDFLDVSHRLGYDYYLALQRGTDETELYELRRKANRKGLILGLTPQQTGEILKAYLDHRRELDETALDFRGCKYGDFDDDD